MTTGVVPSKVELFNEIDRLIRKEFHFLRQRNLDGRGKGSRVAPRFYERLAAWLQNLQRSLIPWQGRLPKLGSMLLYHEITNEIRQPDFHPHLGLKVSLAEFEQQMEILSNSHHCLPLSTAVSLLQSHELPRNSAVVTFDDGYRDGLTLALPVLERYGVPATIFVTTGFVNGTARLWWRELERVIDHCSSLSLYHNHRTYDFVLVGQKEKLKAFTTITEWMEGMDERQLYGMLEQLYSRSGVSYEAPAEILSWEEVIELDKHPLITIGAHTVNHLALSLHQARKAFEEMLQSKTTLESHLGHEVGHFAYPYGGRRQVSLRDFGLARRAGFRSACVTYFGHLEEIHSGFCHALPRITVDYFDTAKSFKRKLNGFDAFVYAYLKGNRPPISERASSYQAIARPGQVEEVDRCLHELIRHHIRIRCAAENRPPEEIFQELLY